MTAADATILVIDDIELNCALLQRKLNKHGYRVELAGDGQEGLMQLNRKKIDLILLDLNMPIMNGFTFMEKVKSNPSYSHIPIIVFTSIDDEDTAKDCLLFGARGYVSKADDLQELLKMIDSCLTA